jgi:hypothetical protein
MGFLQVIENEGEGVRRLCREKVMGWDLMILKGLEERLGGSA